MKNTKKYPGQLVFGLDIGTRSIVGTVGYKKDDMFYVVAQTCKEHETRAMLDGQIHDINQVGKTITEVKEILEKKIGRKLEKVCIAAAGRVLKTIQIHTNYDFEEERTVTEEDIYTLHSLATEDAYKEFLKNDDSDLKFYCVGSSVVRYYMNDYVITQPKDHKARRIGVDMIATFLPDDVVDGLHKAVEIAGLSVANMTLEPIAAIELAIPEKFRLLNIALVDVGAGTSDISITKEGTIIAFGMIPVAGDSLTESVAFHCMVDFNNAENIKRQIDENDTIEYEDIMGMKQTITKEEVVSVLTPSVDKMTREVAEKIKELNGDKSVGAVFVVGGGGKVPGYTEKLAEYLQLPAERVALRGKEVMQSIVFEDDEMEKNSLLVTPIGICLDFYKETNNFLHVSFNDASVKLFNNQKLTVMDAAMQADFPSNGFFPKSGKELNFTVNGKKRIVRGDSGEPAQIFVNDAVANLHTQIKEGDIIRVIESTAGNPGKMDISGLAEYKSHLAVMIDEKRVELPKFASVNGNLQSGYYAIKDGDEIQFLDYYTVDQICQFLDMVIDPNKVCMVNNREAGPDTKVYENFDVAWVEKPQEEPEYEEETVEEVVEEPVEPAKTETAEPPKAEAKEEAKEEPTIQYEKAARDIHVMVNNINVTMSGKASYVYVDVFNYISFDLSKPQGQIVTTLNGKDAQYMQELHEGDVIEIYWRKV